MEFVVRQGHSIALTFRQPANNNLEEIAIHEASLEIERTFPCL